MGGIYIGKFSKETETKVPTFLIRENLQYYYANRCFKFRESTRPATGIMFLSAPELLAFWSEDAD
jgi:hypothetical protein